MSVGWSALCAVAQQLCWFLSGLWDALPFGLLFGLVIGPFRISGVDFGKWYRDPGEVNEGEDRSWIGAMRTCLLYCARVFWLLLALVVGLALACVLWGWAVDGAAIRVAGLGEQWLRHGPTAGGLLAGLGLAQLLVNRLWELGLGRVYRRHEVEPLAAPAQQTRTQRVGDWIAAKAPETLRQAFTPPEKAERRALAKPQGKPDTEGAKREVPTTQEVPATQELAAKQEGSAETDEFVPRRLIICCDGTWNRPEDGHDTNVVRLARAIKPQSETKDKKKIIQIVRYHLGVGTGNILDRLIGGGAGVGLSGSVKTCYGFLVDNYRCGDEILLFGFSRGAYVARSIAGLIGLVGILRKHEMARFEEVWNYYCQLPRTKADETNLELLAPERHKDVGVQCVGVWDTVGALGIPGSRFCSNSYTFHETGLGAHVRYAFHALALDEERGNFQPAVWVPAKNVAGQVLKQVWFPGVHSNVGGGYVQRGLANTTFLWMLAQLVDNNLLDIDLDAAAKSMREYEAEQYARGALQNSRSAFWRLAFSRVPRPVGLADKDEKIHESAFRRACATYASGTKRRTWLEEHDKEMRQPREGLELCEKFDIKGAGIPHTPLIPSRQGWCEWLNVKIFGDQ